MIKKENEAIIRNLSEIAVKAGEEIMKIYNSEFNVELKDDDTPLTIADKRSNDIIIDHLKKNYPDYAILSEESIDDKSRLENDYCFIVDPLDGTKEFINRNGEFAVNIALVYKGEPIYGVMYAPYTKKLYYAARGDGAYIETLPYEDVEEIKVTDSLDCLTWIGSRSHYHELEDELLIKHQNKIAVVKSMGCALKGCILAEGKADVYYRYTITSEWDIAAMHLIVEEAGGVVRNMDGSKIIYNRENPKNEMGFYAVNRKENIWVKEAPVNKKLMY